MLVMMIGYKSWQKKTREELLRVNQERNFYGKKTMKELLISIYKNSKFVKNTKILKSKNFNILIKIKG